MKLVKIAAPCKLPVLAVSNTAVKQEDYKTVSTFEHECEMNASLLSIDNVHVLPDPKQIRNESNEKEASLIKTNQMPSLADAEVEMKKSHGLFVPGNYNKDKHSYSMVETMKVLRPKRQINTPIQRNPKVTYAWSYKDKACTCTSCTCTCMLFIVHVCIYCLYTSTTDTVYIVVTRAEQISEYSNIRLLSNAKINIQNIGKKNF